MSKFVVEREPEFSVRPGSYLVAGISIVVVGMVGVLGLWLFSDVRHEVVALSIAPLVVVFIIFFDMHTKEQKLGPYIVAKRDGVHLRHGKHVPLTDFSGFEVTCEKATRSNYYIEKWIIVLRRGSGEQIEVVSSDFDKRSVLALKLSMERRIAELIASGSVTND